jgi:hypothetical protein
MISVPCTSPHTGFKAKKRRDVFDMVAEATVRFDKQDFARKMVLIFWLQEFYDLAKRLPAKAYGFIFG